MLYNPSETNAIKSLTELLRLSKVSFTPNGLRQALEEHSDFPSLSALCDVLNDFKVKNIGTRMTADRLMVAPLPALVYLDIEGGIFVPMRNVSESVEWYHTERGWQNEPFDRFIQNWSGIALLIDPDEHSGERDYKDKRRKDILNSFRVPLTVYAILLSLGLLVAGASGEIPFLPYLYYYLLGLTKIMGTIVSGLIVWYSLNSKSTFFRKVCRLHSKADCQNILTSSAAKLTNWLSWAELGLFYFSGGLLIWSIGLLLGNADLINAINIVLFFLAVLALPYTIWSVYYQWKIAREWCIMCLSVQALFWIEFILSIANLEEINNFDTIFTNINFLTILLVSFIVTPLIWMWVKPNLLKSSQFSSIAKEFQKLKFDPNYLSGLISKPRVLPPIFTNMNVIFLGNPSAKNILTLVTNPACSSCRKNHHNLERLIRDYSNLQVRIILSASTHEEDLSGKVARQILDLSAEEMPLALSRWFEVGERFYKEWNMEIGGTHLSKSAKEQLQLHVLWLELAGVVAAPAYFLNSVELPKFYQLYELPKLCAAFENLEIAQSQQFIRS